MDEMERASHLGAEERAPKVEVLAEAATTPRPANSSWWFLLWLCTQLLPDCQYHATAHGRPCRSPVYHMLHC